MARNVSSGRQLTNKVSAPPWGPGDRSSASLKVWLVAAILISQTPDAATHLGLIFL